MKQILTIIISIMMISNLSACDSGEKRIDIPNQQENNNQPNETKGNLKVVIEAKEFIITLEANATAEAFKKMLPMTINMSELNNNEKYYDLPRNLPTNSTNPRNIKNGDLMLYGSNTLVLFYKDFTTAYSYTRLGKVEDTAGLEAVLGSRSVTVTFKLEP